MRALYTLLFIIVTITTSAQDTTFIDYQNRTYNSVPQNFYIVDTSTVKDDSTTINHLMVGPNSIYSDTLKNTYSNYYVEYTVNKLQGGTSGFLTIDTNNVQLSFTSLSSVSGTFIDDSLLLDSGSIIEFDLSASVASTALQLMGEIYHTTTYIQIDWDVPSFDTIYFDKANNQTVSRSFASQFVADSTIKDTLYLNDTTANVWTVATTVTHNVPTTYSAYLVLMELVHKQGAYNYDVDTNSTSLTSNTASHLSVNGPIYDTITISGGSSIDYNISNINNSGRYEVTSTIIHTVDTVFINSMSTSLFDKVTPKVEFTLYPNPTVNDINITFDNPTMENVTFNIFDMSGRMVKQGNLINKSIDVSELQPGVYSFHLFSNNKAINKSFIKYKD